MRPGIRHLKTEAVFILNLQARLQRIIALVGIVRILVDTRESRKDAREIGIVGACCNAFAEGTIQRQSVDVASNVLMPAVGADILNDRNDGRRQLLLDAKTVFRCAGAGVMERETGNRGREIRSGRRKTGQRADGWVRKLHIGCCGNKRNRRVCLGGVNIVALNAFVEYAESAPQRRSSASIEVHSKSDTRLEC